MATVNDEMDEIDRLQRELENMPEWDRLWSVREFEATVRIFRTNAAEVLTFLDDREQRDVNGSPFETAAFRDLQQELARLVHNFTASAFTLVDHARAFFTGRYGSSALYVAYDKEVGSRFKEGPLHNFVQGLRNYIVHHRLPPMTTMRTWSQGGRVTHFHFWQKSDLLKWNRWTPAAKVFLEQALDQVHVRHVVSDYEKLVNSFYDWVFDRLKDFHSGDERAVAIKQQQIDALVQKLATS
jgi:hypothetical protein